MVVGSIAIVIGELDNKKVGEISCHTETVLMLAV